ncbi:MAG: hypothetical protein J5845_09595 [Lachnospiraceae bacterium]|nr:hypothetical protein [Lachnospiraceae bacterium]
MAYCPNCKKEYGLSVTFCPECNVALVDDDEAKVPMFSLAKEEAAQGFVAYAKEQGVSCAYEYSQHEDTYKIFVSKKQQKKGPKLFAEFLVQENRKKKGDNALPAKEPPRKPVIKEEPKVEEALQESASAKDFDDDLDDFLAKAPEPAKPVNFYIPPIRKKTPVKEAEKEPEAPAVKPAAKTTSKTETASTNPAAALFDAPPKRAPYKDRFSSAAKTEEKKSEEKPAAPVEKPAPKKPAMDFEEIKKPVRPEKAEEAPAAEEKPFVPDDSVIIEERIPAAETKKTSEDLLKAFEKPPVKRPDPIKREEPVKPAPVKREEPAAAAPVKPVAPVRKPEPVVEPKKEEPKLDSKSAAISLFESKPVGKRDQRPTGPVLNKTNDKTKHSDLLNLFLNPAQAAPKRAETAPAAPADGNKFSVAPGEDPVFDMPSDPFFGKRNTKPSYVPSAKEPVEDSENAPVVDDLFAAPDFDNPAIDSYTVPEPEYDIAEEAPAEEPADDYPYTYSSEPDFEPEESDGYYAEETDDRNSDPIFVEVEPIKDEELDSDNIVEAANVISIEKDEEEPEYEAGSDDAFDTFLSNYRKGDTASYSDAAYEEPTDEQGDDILDSFLDDVHNMEDKYDEGDLEISEVVPGQEYDFEDYDISLGSGRPKDIQDTAINVSADSNIIEEVFDTDVEVGQLGKAASSVANPDATSEDLSKAPVRKPRPARKIDNYSDIDDYAGFVPDYSFEDTTEVEETPEEAAYREFTEKVAERKRAMDLAASQQKSEQTRKANLEYNLDKKGKKGKIVFEDYDDLDSYAGFIPDYKPNTDNEKDFEFYKPHTVSSYAKYKKGKKDTSDSSLMNMTHMRATNADEIRNVFIEKIPNGIKNVMDPSLVRSTGFIISMSGKQLAQLFNSWLLLNMTSGFVKQFEKHGATLEENAESKIAGMKNVLTNTFGELNESFLDYVVRRYYSKYLED